MLDCTLNLFGVNCTVPSPSSLVFVGAKYSFDCLEEERRASRVRDSWKGALCCEGLFEVEAVVPCC